MANEKKFYGMRNDYMFHAVLQKNEVVLRHLVATLMKRDVNEITSCRIENPIELGNSIDDKDCILDIKLVLNESDIINIELQIRKQEFWKGRSLLYWSRAFDSLKTGETFDKLKPTCHIGILDFTLFEEHPKLLSEYRITEVEDGYVYSDFFDLRILDLTQVESAEQIANANPLLIKWAKVFKAETLAELESLIENEEVFEQMVFTLKQLSEDEKIRMQCEARERYERNLLSEYASGYKLGTTEGRAQGIVESGIESGWTEEAIKNKLVERLNITMKEASDYYNRFADNGIKTAR